MVLKKKAYTGMMAITKNEVLQIVVKRGTNNQNDFIEFVNLLF